MSRPSSLRPALAAVGGALVPIAALAAYHDQCFGSPWTTPYHHVTDAGFAEIHGRGLLGLSVPSLHSMFEHLLSPWGGLLVWCPIVVVAIAALVERSRGDAPDVETRLSLAIVTIVLLVNLGLEQTGGWRVGPRYFVLALPFIIPGLAQACAVAAQRPIWFAALVGLTAWPAFANALAATFFPHLIPAGNPLRDQLLPLWLDGRSPYGLTWTLGLGTLGPTLVLLGSVALAVGPLVRLRPPGSDGRKSLGLGLLTTTVWAAMTLSVPPDEAAASTGQALEGMWEPNPDAPREPRPLRRRE